MEQALSSWKTATADLPYGVQRVFMDALTTVKDEQVHMIWGSDYRDGKPCLVNAVASMLTTGGGEGVPSAKFGAVVSAFDTINSKLLDKGINKDRYVSPLAAEILLRNFGELKPEPDQSYTESVAEASHGRYIERSDEEIAQDWFGSMTAPPLPVVEEMADNGNDVAKFARDYITGI